MKCNKLVFYLLEFAMVFTAILLLYGEVQTVLAWWIMITCLLPILILSWQTAYLSIKIFCAIIFVTQFVSLPLFFLQPLSYTYAIHRSFDFTALEVLPIYLPLGLFMLLMICLAKGAEWPLGTPSKLLNSPSVFSKYTRINPAIIVMFVIVLIPWHFWMFKMGIGITGVASPKLPYRLSGIMIYLQNYIIPITIGILYFKTDRNSLLLLLVLSAYGLLLGISTASRGVTLLVFAPVIAAAWLDKKRLYIILSSSFAGFSFLLVSASRAIIYVSDGLIVGANTSLGSIGTMMETFSRMEFSLQSFVGFLNIADRIEGFQGLLLGSRFNAEAVGGVWGIFFKAIDNRLVDLNHDSMHIEFLGHTVLEGFNSVTGSLISLFFMASNRNIMMMLPFSILAVFMLLILEKNLFHLAQKYRINLLLVQALLFYLSFLYYTAPGAVTINSIFIILIILRVLPSRTSYLGKTYINRLRLNSGKL